MWPRRVADKRLRERHSGDVTVEGWTETLTHQSWTITANLLPWDVFRVAIHDHPNSLYDGPETVLGY